ncbi:MAG: hypothetical protein HGA86_02170, partial [Anaerolineaceae bacterium]|nr:hypothetical protein [Anaerolineaceae bacterium]
MIKILSKVFFVLCGFHGLIHISGFTAYFPLAENPNLPYKTALWMGSLEVGAAGMRIFSILWLLAGLGYLIAVLAGLFKRAFWAPLMLAATLLSLAICVLDWQAAFRGALIDIAILLVLALVFGLRKLPAKFPPPVLKAG